jgi:hypothetical protein
MAQESTCQQKRGGSDKPNRTDTINGMRGCHRDGRKLAFPFYFANGIRGKREMIKSDYQKKIIRGDQVEETCNPPGDNSELAM